MLDCGPTYLGAGVALVPDKGAMISQFNNFDFAGGFQDLIVEAQRLLHDNEHPKDIRRRIANPNFDQGFVALFGVDSWTSRQQGYVNMHGQFDGAICPSLQAAMQTSLLGDPASVAVNRGGTFGSGILSANSEEAPRITYSVQGNINAPGLVDQVADAFEAGGTCDDFAHRLKAALEAGLAAGGDLRCGGASEAIFKIMDRHGNVLVDLAVHQPGGNTAVEELVSQFAVGCNSFADSALITDLAPTEVRSDTNRCPSLAMDITDGTAIDADDPRIALDSDPFDAWDATAEPDWFIPQAEAPALDQDGLIVLDATNRRNRITLHLDFTPGLFDDASSRPRYEIWIVRSDPREGLKRVRRSARPGMREIRIPIKRRWGPGLYEVQVRLTTRHQVLGVMPFAFFELR